MRLSDCRQDRTTDRLGRKKVAPDLQHARSKLPRGCQYGAKIQVAGQNDVIVCGSQLRSS